MRLGELPQPHYAPLVDQGGGSRVLEGETLSQAATTLRSRVLELLPNVAPFRSLKETITKKKFDPEPRNGTIGDDHFHIVLGQDSVDFAIQTSDWNERMHPITSVAFFAVETGEHPGIRTQIAGDINTPEAFDLAHRLLDKLARYRDVPENELPLGTTTRRRFTRRARQNLQLYLKTLYKQDVDFSGDTEDEQPVQVDSSTTRKITSGIHDLRLTTIKSAGDLVQEITVRLSDTGNFSYAESFVGPDSVDTQGNPPLSNSTRAKSAIEGVLANMMLEVAEKKRTN